MKIIYAYLISIFLTSTTNAQTFDNQQFFSQLATAINDPTQKRQVIAEINKLGPEHKNNFEASLRNEFKTLDTALPMRIDEYTTLKSAQVFSTAIKYNFNLTQEYMSEFNIEEFKRNVRSHARNEVCSNPRMFFAVFLDFQIMYVYYAPDGSIVQQAIITETDCA